MDIDMKIKALAKHLDATTDDIDEDGDSRFDLGRKTYLVLTDEEADERAEDDVWGAIWAFPPPFIAAHAQLPPEAEDMIADFARLRCEGATETFQALVENAGRRAAFINDAIFADGRGHFLSPYDGKEEEITAEDGTKLYVYRLN